MRRVERREEKRRIAARAVERVHSRSSVALGNGSTTYELARLLGGFTDLTVLTPNIPIALALAEFPSVQTLVPGVTMRSGEASMIGPEAIDAIEQFYFDLAIIGAGGVEPSIGVTEYNSDEATVIRTMVRRSAECIVLADSSKLGRIAPVVVSELERVNGMITTTEADPSIVADLRAAGVEVELT
jgi:DeoR family fructose operon transcriptional repressor